MIRLRGARTHNLRNIDLDLPRERLIVITGLSGSGKSSLAFDTLYAEGQRRYVESLSAYARQFLQIMEKPDVDSIEGLSPAIAIQQRGAASNPRSTVGTVTEIHDYLRLLFARAGIPYCPDHPDRPLVAQTLAQMIEFAMSLPAETSIAVLAPVFTPGAGSPGEEIDARLSDLRTRGFVRFRIDGAIVEGESLPRFASSTASNAPGGAPPSIEVVVDRLRVRPELRGRLAESIETALRIADGKLVLLERGVERGVERGIDRGIERGVDRGLNTKHEVATAFSSRAICPVCGYAPPLLEPRLFSFNNPAGACPGCSGLGKVPFFDAERVVAHPELSIAGGAIIGWDARNRQAHARLRAFADSQGVELDEAWESLPAAFRDQVLHGSQARNREGSAFFPGIIPMLERRWRETDSATVRELLSGLRAMRLCPECGGTRLRREARYVFVGTEQRRLPIQEIEAMPLADAVTWMEELELDGVRREIGRPIAAEIVVRLHFLRDVGLGYLCLDRRADSLSGGEAQRIRLASQIGSGLTGVLYVLDEPSIGLHARDNQRLIETLRRLRDLGNTLIVVEHDEQTIRSADHVVDMGPGAGAGGGMVVAQGSPAQIVANPDSCTGAYLAGRLRIELPTTRRAPAQDWLRLRGATGNNLQSVDFELPIGRMVCVTGVSGSGKSTLVNDTLVAALARHFHDAREEPAPYTALEGLEFFDRVVNVNQAPIGRTPRSNPATYTGMFGPIRDLYAGTVTARERGYGSGRFSFNVEGGRCETCQGEGLIKVEMHFLPDLYVTCETCGGRRYKRETLEALYKGRNIAEVLDLSVDEAREFFDAVPVLARKLRTLADVGLGYVRLGQSATTLSGGEAQRIKLGDELSKRDTGRTLYVLDEPTTGLHFHDIALLLGVLRRLRDAGNTVLIVEHNLDVIKTCDWVIDLGPEGGREGGRIVATGTPEDVAGSPQSLTGKYLRGVLGNTLGEARQAGIAPNMSTNAA